MNEDEFLRHRELMAAALLSFACTRDSLLIVSDKYLGDPVSTSFALVDILLTCSRTGAKWSTATQEYKPHE